MESNKLPERPVVGIKSNNRGSNRGREKQVQKARQSHVRKTGLPRPVTLGRLTPKSIQTLTQRPSYVFRQLFIPSATTLTVSGSGNSYSSGSGQITVGNASACPWSLYFRAGDITNFSTSLNALYDQYKIEEVRVHVCPQYNVAYYNGTLTSFYTFNYTAVDYDDSSVLSALTDIFQYDNVQVHNPYKPYTITLKPRIAVPSGAGFVNEEAGWIDMNDLTVQHYGLKGVFMTTTSISNFYYVVVEALVALRSVR